MTQCNRGPLAIRILAWIWTLTLLFGLVWYIRRCLKRRSVAFFARLGPSSFSRDSEPVFYWVMIVAYVLLAVFLVAILCIGVYFALKEHPTQVQ